MDPWFTVANHAELVILIKIQQAGGLEEGRVSHVWQNWGVGWIQMAAANLIGSSNPN